MNRVARALVVGAAVGVLVLLPWSGAAKPGGEPSFFVDDDVPLFTPPPAAPALAAPIPAPFVSAQPVTGGCGCDTVVINANNNVTDTDVWTGSAKAVNNAVTYISSGYAAQYQNKIDVRVRQIARAISGDATAGQTIGLAEHGSRCHNVLIRARNVLQDVDVRTGNATALNHSTVLVDPGVDPNRLNVRLLQRAYAVSGKASAGQFIGAVDGSNGGGCGKVTVDATNVEDDVTVRSGQAVGTNDNKIVVCVDVGCAAELAALAPGADTVQMCTTSGCRSTAGPALANTLPPAPTWSPSPTPTAAPSEPATPVPEPTGCPRHGRLARLCELDRATPTPSPTPSGSPAASPDATPSATPSPAATPLATPRDG